MKTYVMGIDVGTGSARAGIFDLKGKTVAMASAGYPLSTPYNGWAEQAPEDWWTALCAASREAVAKSGVDPGDIIGISMDATCCTVVAADENYKPLRPAIMWMDVRAAEQAGRIAAMDDPALKYCGFGNLSAEWMPCKALWLKENEPECYTLARRIVESVDWITHRMTGAETLSLNNVSVRWFYDNKRGGWPRAFYEKIGLGDLFEKFPAEVLPMGAPVGPLRGEAAKEMGLVPGIPVAEGGADAHTGVIGLNVTRPGRMALITGSSHLHLGLSETEINAKGILGAFPDAIIPGLNLVEGGQISTGSVVNWVKNLISATAGKQPGQDVYEWLNRKAALLPAGSEGLIMTDYFQGNRTPYTDASMRGMVYGLSLKHGPEHIYRAALEGICYGTEHVLRTFDQVGFKPNEAYICGGAVKSRLWMQLHANVSNLTINVPEEMEAPCLGSAIIGAVGAGAFATLAEAADNMVRFVDRVEPEPEEHEKYKFYVEKYIELYPLLRTWMKDVTEHAAKQSLQRDTLNDKSFCIAAGRGLYAAGRRDRECRTSRRGRLTY